MDRLAGTADAGEGFGETEDGAGGSAGAFDAEAEGSASDEGLAALDLNHLRDLLGILSEFRVQAFSLGGLQVAFHSEAAQEEIPIPRRIVEAIKADDGAGTSSGRIGGFAPQPQEELSGFRNPNLWQAQNGRRLNFAGEYE